MQLNLTLDFSSGKEPTCQCRRCRLDRTLSQEDSLEEDMAAYSSILDWKDLMDKGAWQAAVHGVSKSQTRPSNWVHMHVISQNLCLFFFLSFSVCVCPVYLFLVVVPMSFSCSVSFLSSWFHSHFPCLFYSLVIVFLPFWFLSLELK